MPLVDFLNRHAGETAWMFGKGPSLSTFDFNTAGPLRCAINDVVRYIPGCKYGFANDGVARWADAYWPGMVLFQPQRCLGEFDSTAPGAVLCDVETYHDDHADERLALPRETLAEWGPTIRRGTLGSALQILHIMGVSTIHMVGIDGGGTHAPGFEWKTRLRHDHAADYDAIRNAAIDAAEIMGITLKFHNQTHTMENDGKIFVRITRTCLAEGLHCSAGEIIKLNPRVVRDLINADAAELFTPPARTGEDAPRVETASAPMQATESATVATKKATKARGK